MLNNLAEQFSKTKFGDFKTNISIGKNYGSMKPKKKKMKMVKKIKPNKMAKRRKA